MQAVRQHGMRISTGKTTIVEKGDQHRQEDRGGQQKPRYVSRAAFERQQGERPDAMRMIHLKEPEQCI